MDTIFTDGQLTKMIEMMRQKQLTPERFNLILGSGVLADVFDPTAYLDRAAVHRALTLETFRITVDYGQTLEQMIAAGRYTCDIHSGVAALPVKGGGVVKFEARLFRFDGRVSSRDAVRNIEKADPKNPWAAAKIEHLLSFGLTLPEALREFPIAAFGVKYHEERRPITDLISDADACDVRRGVPCLNYDGTCPRRLVMYAFGFGWDPWFRFLGVRKISGR